MKAEIKGLKRVRLKMDDMQKMKKLDMKEIAFRGHAAVMQNFRDQKGRSTPWKANQRGGMILQDTGILRNSIKSLYGPRFATIVTNLKYAAIHNFGGKTGRNKSVKMPKREFMYLNKKTKTAIKKRMAKMIVKGF